MGRPPVHPEGVSRMTVSRARIRDAGGHIMELRLDPEAAQALRQLREAWETPNDTATVAEALLRCARRQRKRD
jgi:hypothetical protein